MTHLRWGLWIMGGLLVAIGCVDLIFVAGGVYPGKSYEPLALNAFWTLVIGATLIIMASLGRDE